jgi:hypothetical protein
MLRADASLEAHMPSKARFAIALAGAFFLAAAAVHASPLGAVNAARLVPAARTGGSSTFSCAGAPQDAFVAFLSGAYPYNQNAEFGGALFWAQAGSRQWSLCGGQSGPVNLGPASTGFGYVKAYNDAAAVWDPSCARPRTVCILAPNAQTVPVVRFVTGKPGRVIGALHARRRFPLGVTVSSGTAYVATYSGAVLAYQAGETQPSGRTCELLCSAGFAIATAPDGSIYVASERIGSDESSAVVRFAPPSGKAQVLKMGSDLGLIAGIAIDSGGNVLLADPYEGSVDIFTSDTHKPASAIRTRGTPQSIALDAAQTHLYVTDPADGWAAVYTYPAGDLVVKATIKIDGVQWSPSSVFAL